MADSGAKVLVTSPALKKKIKDILPKLPELEKIISVERGKGQRDPDDIPYKEAVADAADSFETVKTNNLKLKSIFDYNLIFYYFKTHVTWQFFK